jgi:hypothetical protein
MVIPLDHRFGEIGDDDVRRGFKRAPPVELGVGAEFLTSRIRPRSFAIVFSLASSASIVVLLAQIVLLLCAAPFLGRRAS